MSFGYSSVYEMCAKPVKKEKYFLLKTMWLGICLALCIILIVVGAYTRLSNSGLSISYWKPITSWLLPLTTDAWDKEFEIYKNFPEYGLVNHGMSLEEFKYIFGIEYLHRLIAKLLGAIYIIPGMYLILTNQADKKEYFLTSFCILLQGLFGWLMVRSGLIDKPYVNHINLAIHLKMGIFIYFILFSSFKQTLVKYDRKICSLSSKHKFLLRTITALFFLQVFLGGMMAGLDGGKIYQSFPLMGKTFIPTEIIQYGIDFNDPVTIHFFHRLCAYLLTIAMISFNFGIIKSHPAIGIASICLILLQICFGFAILFYQGSVLLPILHSFMGIIIASLIVEYHFLK